MSDSRAKKVKDQRIKNVGDAINKRKLDEMEKSRKKVDSEMKKRRK